MGISVNPAARYMVRDGNWDVADLNEIAKPLKCFEQQEEADAGGRLSRVRLGENQLKGVGCKELVQFESCRARLE